jgi:hypothetical protein
VIAFLYVGGVLLFGYVIHAAHQTTHQQARAEIKRLTTERVAERAAAAAALDQANLALHWANLRATVAEGERDIASTALRAKFEQEARADLIHPDQPVGEARVFKLKAVR